MQALDNYISQIKTLPPAPRVLTQLLTLLDNDDVPAAQIQELIAFDPALTAKVLQRCNNAAAGLDHPVADLGEAVTRMGFNAIFRMVTLVIGEGLLSSEQPGYGIGMGKLWEHSVTTALSAKTIAQSIGGDADIAFTAGLLHDIGKIVLGSFLEGSRLEIIVRTGPSGLSFLEAEKEILGAEHAEIGGRLLQRWNFPENLVRAVWFHHHPAQAAPHDALAAVVHLGDIIAHYLGMAEGFESFAVHTRPEAFEILDLNPAMMDAFVIETSSALQTCGWLATAHP